MGFSFGDVGNAKKSEGGNYFKPGFIGSVRIDRCTQGIGQTDGLPYFAVNTLVQTSNLGADGRPVHTAGEPVGQVTKVKPNTPAMGNIRDFMEKGLQAAAEQGIDWLSPLSPAAKADIEKNTNGEKVDMSKFTKETNNELGALVTGEKNILNGVILNLATVNIKTKHQQKDFTKLTWSVPDTQASAA